MNKHASIYSEPYQGNQEQKESLGFAGFAEATLVMNSLAVNWKSCCNQDGLTEPELGLLHHLCPKDFWPHGQSHLPKTCVSLSENFRNNFHATDHFQLYNVFCRERYTASHTKKDRNGKSKF